jgi:hypothetical protein
VWITREQRGSFFDPFITVKKKRRGRRNEREAGQRKP